MKKVFLFAFILCAIHARAQMPGGLTVFHIPSSHTSFPDTGRSNGHLYKNTLYDAATHYQDSSVMIMVPPGFKANKSVDIICWFHGWGNNIDSAAIRYQLAQQFLASQLNAIFVMAETAKNAPDSYGGKLETTGIFKGLISDVLVHLKKEQVLPKKTIAGNIILAGHSGAYRVMAYIIKNGEMPVKEAILFDALYGEADKYMDWIKASKEHRFIDIYTNGGGTDVETKGLVKQLNDVPIACYTTEESSLTPEAIQSNRIVVIHSLHEHNDIINNPDNFQLFLENSPFLRKIRK